MGGRKNLSQIKLENRQGYIRPVSIESEKLRSAAQTSELLVFESSELFPVCNDAEGRFYRTFRDIRPEENCTVLNLPLQIRCTTSEGLAAPAVTVSSVKLFQKHQTPPGSDETFVNSAIIMDQDLPEFYGWIATPKPEKGTPQYFVLRRPFKREGFPTDLLETFQSKVDAIVEPVATANS